MLYREAGQYKTSYAADVSVFPLREDRVGHSQGGADAAARVFSGCRVRGWRRRRLEGGVLDVEVPGDAGLQLVQQPRSAAVGQAGVVKSRYV